MLDRVPRAPFSPVSPVSPVWPLWPLSPLWPLWIVSLVACSAAPPVLDGERPPGARVQPTPTLAAAALATPSCVDDATPFAIETLREHVVALASPALDGRFPGTPGDAAARARIAQRFRCLGLAAAGDGDGYEQAFTDPAGHATANVIGYVRGATKPDEIIIVGAHHDHLGGGYLGANDNASGVATLLAIAQAVRQHDAAPARTIAFVTFGAEEQGLVGSSYFVAHPPAELPLAHVVQLVNLDMIGSYASKRAVYAFGAFARQPARTILARLDDAFPRLRVGIGGHSVRGDQLAFCQAGIPYVFFWTPDGPCYHERCDTAAQLDLPHMAQIAELAGGLVRELAATDVDLVASKAKIGCFGR